MSSTSNQQDGEGSRRFPLVQNNVRHTAPQGETQEASDPVSSSRTTSDEDPALLCGGVEADDFLTPRQVIQAVEAVRIRQRRCTNCFSKVVVELDEKAPTSGVREQALANSILTPVPTAVPTTSSPKHPLFGHSSSSYEDDEDTIVAWEEGDPENPYNWSGRKKKWVLFVVMMLIINSTMGSALPSNALRFITDEWEVESEQQKVLPISVYLIGYVMGPILWAPTSEQFGRKRLTLSAFSMFTLFTLACALAPNWPVFLVFRFLVGVFASSPIAVVPGIIADTHADPRSRGRSMGIFFATTLMGPLFAPIVSGYTSTTIGWRWAFWIALIYAGATMIPLAFLPETYGPILLLRRARAIRKTDPGARVVAPHELEKKSIKQLATVVLTRPIRMIIFEPIVNTSCAYLALTYASFYMSFEAFPIIFQDLYGLSADECGLTYLSIAAGCLVTVPIFFTWDNILRRAQERGAPWTRREEYRRLPLACIGGPLFVISLFWLGWTSRESVPVYVPVLAGIPFGIGFMCIFQALLNYLTDAYEIFAASANAAASTSRSLLATVLPLATAPMFARLGIAGACSLLGGLATLMCIIPFVFLWQGPRIRANSKFCIAIRQRREDMTRRIDEQRKRRTLRLASTRMDAAALVTSSPDTTTSSSSSSPGPASPRSPTGTTMGTTILKTTTTTAGTSSLSNGNDCATGNGAAATFATASTTINSSAPNDDSTAVVFGGGGSNDIPPFARPREDV